MGAPDLSEFIGLAKPRRPPCSVAAALEQLTPAEREQIAAAFAQNLNVIPNPAISQWLAKRGHDITWQVLAVHRRGSCGCDG